MGELEPQVQAVEWIPLGRASTEREVLAAVAGALQVSMLEREAVAQLGALLGSQGALLVILDDAEAAHVELGRLLPRWLEQAPTVVFLVTSRAMLRAPGERVLTIEPLDAPAPDASAELIAQSPAVRLFFDRLIGAGGPRPDAALLPIVGQAVAAMQGLPLALEQVAVAMGRYGVDDIAACLESWLKADPRPLAPVEAATAALRIAIDRSVVALPVWAAAALAALSVLRGSFTVEGAEAVIDTSPWPEAPSALDVAQLLVEHGLVATRATASGVPRLELTPVMRAYADERLSYHGAILRPDGQSFSGLATRKDAERRHGEFYSAWGRDTSLARLRGRGSGALLAVLAADRDNLEIALRRAAARQDARVARRTCRALLSLMERRGPVLRVPLLVEPALATYALHAGDAANLHCLAAQALMGAGLLEHARSHVTRGLIRLKEYELPAVRARFMTLTARVALEMKDLARATEVAIAAAEAARAGNDARSTAVTSLYAGFVHARQGRFIDAKRWLDQGLEAVRPADDGALELAIQRMQAMITLRLGDPLEALRQLRSLADLAAETGDLRGEARIRVSLCTVATTLGYTDEAERAVDMAMLTIRAGEEPSALAAAHRALGVLRNRQNRPYEAIEHLSQAGALYTDMLRPVNRGVCAAERGLAWMQTGRLDEAYEQLQAGTELLYRSGAVVEAAGYGLRMGEVLAKMGRADRPRQAADRGVALLREVHAPWDLLLALARRGLLLVRADPAAAARDLIEGERLALDLRLPPDVDGPLQLQALREALSAAGV